MNILNWFIISKGDNTEKVVKLLCEKNHFSFENHYYYQTGVAMGSPPGPILTNIFMSHF